MPKSFVATRDGAGCEVEGISRLKLMELIRDAGNNEMPALCGGCRSCGTCHVHVDPA